VRFFIELKEGGSVMIRDMLRAIAALAFLTAASTQAHADKLQDILSKGVVRVAVPMDSPPFGSVGADGKPKGLDIEMAEMVGKALNVKTELVGVPSANRVAFLVTDKADIVISNLGLTPERAKQVLYSAPYVNTVLGIFGPKNIAVASLDQLGNNKVSATRGSAAANAILAGNPKASLLQFEADSPSAQAYLTGQAELLASSSVTVGALKQQNPDKEFELKVALRASPAHMAVRLGEQNLLSWINTFIYFSQLNGDLDRLSKTYLGTPLQPLPLSLPSL
jgi:polar amino acid transport system substrate-binding protein